MINIVKFIKNLLIFREFLRKINNLQDKYQDFWYNFHKLHTEMDCFLALFINLVIHNST